MGTAYDLANGWLGLDWGSVPTWVGAFSFFVAVLSFLRSQGEKKREHASKVGAWITKTSGDGADKYYVTVSNAGTAPAYEIKVKDSRAADTLVEIPELPGNTSVRQEVKKNSASWHPLQSAAPISVRPSASGILTATIMVEQATVVLELRDALGREWKIDKDRKIDRVKSERYKIFQVAIGSKADDSSTGDQGKSDKT
ncbi:hypothetical protein [Streptomyces sp. NPDC058304]|uniref:hypothetical protein n=1 Tax=Streptomyces sp. NPDC058304 TaxID=3346437 RepID=UPI0036EAF96F